MGLIFNAHINNAKNRIPLINGHVKNGVKFIENQLHIIIMTIFILLFCFKFYPLQ